MNTTGIHKLGKKRYLYGTNEKKLRFTYYWSDLEISKLRLTATSFKQINDVISQLRKSSHLDKETKANQINADLQINNIYNSDLGPEVIEISDS